MNPLSNLALAVLLLAPLAGAAEPKPDVKAAVLATEQKWVDAVIHRDATVLEKLMASDILYTHSSATTQTRAEFIKAATTGTRYASIDFSDEVVRQYGKTVVITHKALFKTPEGREAHLYIGEVWAEEKGGWIMVSRQATKLP